MYYERKRDNPNDINDDYDDGADDDNDWNGSDDNNGNVFIDKKGQRCLNGMKYNKYTVYKVIQQWLLNNRFCDIFSKFSVWSLVYT